MFFKIKLKPCKKAQCKTYYLVQVLWAVRVEYARRALDVVARRTRLAFLNVAAANEALPVIVDIMGRELGWSSEKCKVIIKLFSFNRCASFTTQ